MRESRLPDGPRLLLGAILLLGVVLRIPGVFFHPYEQDELYTIIEATALFDSPLQPGIAARPLYYLLLHPAIDVLARSPAGLRSLSCLFGLLGIWITWRLGARIFGTTAGLVGAFLVAISPWHLHASGMARYWSLVYLLAAAFYGFLHRALAGDRPRAYLAALVVLVLGTVSHPSFVFPAVGVVLGVTVTREDGRWGWRWPTRSAWTYLWVPYTVAVGTLFLALTVTGNESDVRNFGGRGLPASLRLIPAMVQWMTPIQFAAGGIGALTLLAVRSRPEYRRWGAIATFGALTGLLLLLLAAARTDVYADYGIAILPLLFVSSGALVQVGIQDRSAGRHWFGWIAAAILAAGILPTTVSELSDGSRFDYRPAFRYIASHAPDATVLTTPISLQRKYAPELDGRELIPRREFLDGQLERERDLWVVASVRRYGIVGDYDGELRDWLDTHCRRAASHQRPRLDYRVYRVDLFRCVATSTAPAPPAGG